MDSDQARGMVGARNGSDTDHDFYETPIVATEALLRVETFDGTIWEPACGAGAISTVLQQHGYAVYSSDLIYRGYGIGGVDFLKQNNPTTNIITNPPFGIANGFVKHALDITDGKVAMLLRLAWIAGQRRKKLFDKYPPKKIWVFSWRIPRMHRPGYDGPKSTSLIDFCWFIWDKGYNGPTEIGWL